MVEVPHSRPAYHMGAHAPYVRGLELEWARRTGMESACAVGSGLAALRLALLALNVGPGDEVVVPAYSCVALLNAPLALAATPVLADVKNDWTLDPADVQRRVTERTRAIVAVHLFGAPADIEALQRLKLPVVADCAHGLVGKPADLNVGSFWPTKLIAGAGGGIVGGPAGLVGGIRRRVVYGDQEPDGRNLNDALSDLQAAVALQRLDELYGALDVRQQQAARYRSTLPAVIWPPAPSRMRSWYRYTPLLPDDRTAAEVVAAMKALGVHAEQPIWDLRGSVFWRDDLPVADAAFERLISLPLYPGLTESEQTRVIQVFREVVG